ncbi:hypothetical protein V6N13_043612 [Hibiscus sabdariffa]
MLFGGGRAKEVGNDRLKMVHVKELLEEDAHKNPSVRVITSRSQRALVESQLESNSGNGVGGATFHNGGKLLAIRFGIRYKMVYSAALLQFMLLVRLSILLLFRKNYRLASAALMVLGVLLVPSTLFDGLQSGWIMDVAHCLLE